MANPKPRPTALKLLHGERNKKRINLREPKPAPIAPGCPIHLDRISKAEWKRVAPELEQLGILSRIDRAALAAYCQTYARWVQAEKELQKEGSLFIVTEKGYMLPHPLTGVAHKALLAMHRFLTEFGMTPSSRSRIVVKPPGDDDQEGLLD